MGRYENCNEGIGKNIVENLKAKTLLKALNKAPPTGLIIECGCIRELEEQIEDGFSTVYLAQYAKDNGRDFSSFDISIDNVLKAKNTLKKRGLFPSVYCKDGTKAIKYISNNPFSKPISFLYLDSHRHPSFSLEQYMMAKLIPGSIVCIDDAFEYDGFQYGKATFLKQLFEKQNIEHSLEPTFSNNVYQNYMLVAIIKNGKESNEV